MLKQSTEKRHSQKSQKKSKTDLLKQSTEKRQSQKSQKEIKNIVVKTVNREKAGQKVKKNQKNQKHSQKLFNSRVARDLIIPKHFAAVLIDF